MKKYNMNFMELVKEMTVILKTIAAVENDADIIELLTSAMSDVVDLSYSYILSIQNDSHPFGRVWSVFDSICLMNRAYDKNRTWLGKKPLAVYKIGWNPDSWYIEKL